MPEIIVVGPADQVTGGIARYIADQQRHLKFQTVRVYNNQPTGESGTVGFLLKVAGSLVRMATFPLQRYPDVVHVHTSQQYSFYLSSYYVLFASFVWRRPVILHIHGSSFDDFLQNGSSLLRRFQTNVLNRCTAVLVLSEYWEDILAERVTREKIIVMPNAVSVADFDPAFAAGDPHIVFVSNLVDRKGVNEFLLALDQLMADDALPAFDVTIAGNGSLAERVASFADQHESVTYLGYVSEVKKQALLSAGTIFVLPSKAEGLPIALLEGMAGGNAVVTTNVGSIPEVIGPENGRVVPPEDVDALIVSLRELLLDPQLAERMGRCNRALAAESFSWTSIANQLTELYMSVTNPDEPPPPRSSDGHALGSARDG